MKHLTVTPYLIRSLSLCPVFALSLKQSWNSVNESPICRCVRRYLNHKDAADSVNNNSDKLANFPYQNPDNFMAEYERRFMSLTVNERAHALSLCNKLNDTDFCMGLSPTLITWIVEGPIKDDNDRALSKVKGVAEIDTVYTDENDNVFICIREFSQNQNDMLCAETSARRGYIGLPVFLFEQMYNIKVSGLVYDIISLDISEKNCLKRCVVMATDDQRVLWKRQILSSIKLYRLMQNSHDDLFLCADASRCRTCPHVADCDFS